MGPANNLFFKSLNTLIKYQIIPADRRSDSNLPFDGMDGWWTHICLLHIFYLFQAKKTEMAGSYCVFSNDKILDL